MVTVIAKTEPKLRQELNRQISFIRCFVLCNIGDIEYINPDVKLFARILQTKQRKEITKPLKARPVTADFGQITSSQAPAHNREFRGCFEEGAACVITETRTQLHESALSLSCFKNPVGRYLGPVFWEDRHLGPAEALAKGGA